MAPHGSAGAASTAAAERVDLAAGNDLPRARRVLVLQERKTEHASAVPADRPAPSVGTFARHPEPARFGRARPGNLHIHIRVARAIGEAHRERLAGDRRVDDIGAGRPPGGIGGVFVGFHEPRIAGDIGGQDRCQPALDGFFRHLLPVPAAGDFGGYSKENYDAAKENRPALRKTGRFRNSIIIVARLPN